MINTNYYLMEFILIKNYLVYLVYFRLYYDTDIKLHKSIFKVLNVDQMCRKFDKRGIIFGTENILLFMYFGTCTHVHMYICTRDYQEFY